MKWLGVALAVVLVLWLFAPEQTTDLIKTIVGAASDRAHSH